MNRKRTVISRDAGYCSDESGSNSKRAVTRRPLVVPSMFERMFCSELLIEILLCLSLEDLRSARETCRWFRLCAEDVLETVLPYGERCWMAVARMLTFKGVDPYSNRATSFYRKLRHHAITQGTDMPELMTVEVRDVFIHLAHSMIVERPRAHEERYRMLDSAMDEPTPVFEQIDPANTLLRTFVPPAFLPNVVEGGPDICIDSRCCFHRKFLCWRLAEGIAGYCAYCQHTVSFTITKPTAHGHGIVRTVYGNNNDYYYQSGSETDSSSSSSDDDSDSDSSSSGDEIVINLPRNARNVQIGGTAVRRR